MSAFDLLHSAVQHHIVNSLGWRDLRPVQEQAIQPLIAGEHALIVGPTAGGKTEAAFFPLLSRILTERHSGLALLYVCPLRALLNNLEPRLEYYTSLVGRRAALWHGDLSQSARKRILADPPDCLLTTPESLEVMLVSHRIEHASLFADVRSVIVDELHAFASDDRGWHLLAILERISRLADRELQRVGLSATVGNPKQLLDWLTGTSSRAARVVSVARPSRERGEDVEIDFVGNLENAATVISRLHHGEKRLVFCDSRARVENLSALLRRAGVNTHVSHSSLSLDERRRAEEAFASATDCVIVATSTLELGIDVGDMNRVIQIDAPNSVSSFLQRLGRTGRRPGTTRNCLFLTTSQDTLVRAGGLVQLWSEGYVEDVLAPSYPLHMLSQQILALGLQEHGIGSRDWPDWVGAVPGFSALDTSDVAVALQYMLDKGILWNEDGILSIGPEGEATFGRRNFLELLSAFTTEPLFTVRFGHDEIGKVHQASFVLKEDRPPVLLLGGKSWVIRHLDWDARVAFVEPTELEGKSRWIGSGQPLRFSLCQAVRKVLTHGSEAMKTTERARDEFARIRENFHWLEHDSTVVVRGKDERLVWWTFGGRFANAAISERLKQLNIGAGRADNFSITLDPSCNAERLIECFDEMRCADVTGFTTPVSDKTIDDLKFSVCLPRHLAKKELELRMSDPAAIREVLEAPVRFVTIDADR